MNQFYPRYLLISALCCWLTLGKAQQLIDVAGNGTPAFSGDNGPALNAALNGPSAFVVTPNNELWIADIDNHRIRVINLNNGIIRTVAGTGTASFSGDGGGAIRATFNQPKDLFQDVNGHILVTDPGNHRVRKIDPVNNIVTTVAGNGSSNYVEGARATETGIPNPGSVTADPQGNIYITDNVLRKVLRVDRTTGTINTFAGSGSNTYSGDGGQARDAGIPEPHVVRYHPVHGILLTDIDANVIRKISLTTGIIATIVGDGNPGYSGDGGPATLARLNIPLDMNIDSAGNIYIADGNNHVIRKLDHTTGLISTIAGTGKPGYDGPNIFYHCSRINVPVAVVWAPDGLIYIGEWEGLRIRKIDPTPINPTRPSARISQLPTEICPDQPLLLTVERVGGFAGDLEMEWFKNGRSTGYFGESVTLPTINNGDVISLRIRGRNNTCGVDSVSVQTVPLTLANVEPAIAEIRGDSSLCPQQDALFTASSNYRLKDINWTVNNVTRAQGPSFQPSGLADGNVVQFRARVDTTGCLAGTQVFSRPIAIEILPAPPLALTPKDTSITLGNTVVLRADTDPGITQFRWTGTGVRANGGDTQTLQPERTGTYTVSITSNLGCVQTASAKVRVIKPVYIPNSFTPNADGKNDIFRVPPDIDIDMISLRVFNRFGQLVWSSADPGAGWDGNIKGQPAPVGSYAYLLTYREDKTIVERKGTVTLIR